MCGFPERNVYGVCSNCKGVITENSHMIEEFRIRAKIQNGLPLVKYDLQKLLDELTAS